MPIFYNDGTVTHVGCVFGTYQADYRAMSDVYTYASYATVWNAEKRCVENVMFNANFECDQGGGRAIIDATPELITLRKNIDRLAAAEQAERESVARAKRIEEAKAAERNRPVHGKKMTVVRGRKCPKGTTGVVFWISPDGVRVGLDTQPGIKDEKGYAKHVAWTYAEYLVAA